jgi:hypothetical protein
VAISVAIGQVLSVMSQPAHGFACLFGALVAAFISSPWVLVGAPAFWRILDKRTGVVRQIGRTEKAHLPGRRRF